MPDAPIRRCRSHSSQLRARDRWLLQLPIGGRYHSPHSMDGIYQRTHLGGSLLHALQKLCVAGQLEGAEARDIITDFNEVRVLVVYVPAEHMLYIQSSSPSLSTANISPYAHGFYKTVPMAGSHRPLDAKGGAKWPAPCGTL